MTTLDINDWQLTVRDADGAITLKEPAGASTAEGKLAFGDVALKYSRSHPQQFNNKYFYSLAADPISGDLRPAKNHADLIYHHLMHLNLPSEEPLTLCVGGHLTNQQLGLLLGICSEAGLDVAGFIDLAIGQSLCIPIQNDYHVLDIELHRITLSHITVTGDCRELQQTVTMDGVGVANIVVGWMNVIADEFVQKTRFDPMHAGQSEQQLFDQVSGWLSQETLVDQRVSVANGEANRDIEIGKNLILEKLRQRLHGFEFGHVEDLVITPRAAGIPGLQQLLEERVARVTPLSEADIAANYASLIQQLDGQEIRRISSANMTQSATAQPEVPEQSASRAATHLMADHIAYPFDADPISGHIDPDTARTISTTVAVNGIVALDRPVSAGDTVHIAKQMYVAICLQ